MKEFLKVMLDLEPVTWGTNDAEKRARIRQEVKKHISSFDEAYIKEELAKYKEIEVILDCHLIAPESKDIDNLSKIPIDAIFFAAQNEPGYQTWESKITSLIVRKRKGDVPLGARRSLYSLIL